MMLDSRHSGFILLFPPTFFNEELKKTYKNYVKQLMLPYETLDDFMSSTVQSVSFPGWDMSMPQQIRKYGAEQDFKSSKQVKDLLERDITITFQIVDGWANYFIFLDNAIRYLDFNNDKDKHYFDVMRLGWLSREGYLLGYMDMKKLILNGMSGFKLSYSSINQEFNTFDAKFKFNDWNITSLVSDFQPMPIGGVGYDFTA